MLHTDRASLTRHVPAEFAERQARLLRCAECHGKFEGFPPWETLGGKLKPEWMKAFIGGELAYKPRPWIEPRMPAFPQYADALATGLTEEQGLPPRTSAEPPIDMETAKIGRKLVSANGGFFCVSCHAVGQCDRLARYELPASLAEHLPVSRAVCLQEQSFPMPAARRAKSDQAGRNYFGVIEHQAIARSEQVRQIAHVMMRKFA